MWTIIMGLIAGGLGWKTLHTSETIKTDEGEFYDFPKEWRIASAFLGGLMALRLTYQVTSGVEGAILTGMAALFAVQFLIDFKYQELANEWNALLGFLGGLYVLVTGLTDWQSRLMAWGIVTVFFFCWWAFSNGLGFGDVKFISATGFLLTTDQIIPYLVLTLSLAIVYGVGVMIVKKKSLKTEFAFGPFLILGLLATGFA